MRGLPLSSRPLVLSNGVVWSRTPLFLESEMKIEVTAFPRTQQGTGASRRLRGSGRVPGVIYGASEPASAIELDHNALLRHLKMEAFHASILDMSVDGSRQRVLLRDFQ